MFDLDSLIDAVAARDAAFRAALAPMFAALEEAEAKRAELCRLAILGGP